LAEQTETRGRSWAGRIASLTVDRRILGVLILLVVLGSAWLGDSRIGTIPTDTMSERNTLREARGLVAGQGRFGIFEYTHYPNGPIYAVAVMARQGMHPRQMRLLPVAISALALGFLLFALVERPSAPMLRVWALAACGVLAIQPGILDWQGALHEHSYVVSLSFLAIGLSAWAPPRLGWLLFPLGFLAGWTGYDWLPAQGLAVVTVRWLYHARSGEADAARAALLAGVDAVRFASGVSLAILSHLLQLALFFGSLEDAIRDLVGSAAVRMGVEGAGGINPEYATRVATAEAATSAQGVANVFGQGFSMTSPNRATMLAVSFSRFVARDIHTWLVSVACVVAAGVAILDLGSRRSARHAPVSRLALVVAVALAGAVAASTTWSLLMPHHAVFHAHFLHRHLLVGLALLLVMPVLLGQPSQKAAPDAPLSASLRPLLAYGSLLVFTVCIFAYAVVAFGSDGS
jgi:hypothetical protein